MMFIIYQVQKLLTVIIQEITNLYLLNDNKEEFFISK